jgi:hypothetical protein
VPQIMETEILEPCRLDRRVPGLPREGSDATTTDEDQVTADLPHASHFFENIEYLPGQDQRPSFAVLGLLENRSSPVEGDVSPA